MREILFRGREKGGTKWFEGDMSYLVHDKCACYIFPPNGYDSPDRYEVDPATVGQYTGLTDKNGAKIFEGDIISTPKFGVDSGKGVNFSGKDKFIVGYDDGTYLLENRLRRFCMRPDKGAEVIGNIYDNPELMEDKQC